MLKKLSYAIGALALLVGLWGFYDRFAFGEQNVNYGSWVVWGLWVAMYFFFGGIAIGSFFVAALEYLFDVKAFSGYGKPALWTSLVTLAMAMASIGLDLGHMERIWKAYLQPNLHSGVAEDVWGYTIFGILALIALVLALRGQKGSAMKVVMGLGFVVALYVAGASGKLLGNNAARPYWHSALLPVQFLFMALTTGAAMTFVVHALFSPKESDRQAASALRVSLLALLVVSVYFTWQFLSQSLYGNVPSVVASVRQLTSGQYAGAFWGLQIVVGILLPVIMLALPKVMDNNLYAGLVGLFVLIGNAVARYLIVVPGLNVSVLNGIETANTGPGLTLAYSPSAVEWAVVSGLVGIALLALALGADYLPLYSKKEA
jgi:molybdopterin-containing oxidoreductase family membrane subunit